MEKEEIISDALENFNRIPRVVYKMLTVPGYAEAIEESDDEEVGHLRYAIERWKNFENRNRCVPGALKNLIILRDGNICQYCGAELSDREITIDHYIPLSRGGRTNFNNLRVACHDCNQAKADSYPHEAA